MTCGLPATNPAKNNETTRNSVKRTTYVWEFVSILTPN
jgi:hypothetical protein